MAPTELTYTVHLSMPIHRDADEPLTAAEAVAVFRDEVAGANWIYRVEMPDGSQWRVDSEGGAPWRVRDDEPA